MAHVPVHSLSPQAWRAGVRVWQTNAEYPFTDYSLTLYDGSQAKVALLRMEPNSLIFSRPSTPSSFIERYGCFSDHVEWSRAYAIISYESSTLTVTMIGSRKNIVIFEQTIPDLQDVASSSGSHVAGWFCAPYVPSGNGPTSASTPSPVITLDRNSVLSIGVDYALNGASPTLSKEQGLYFHDANRRLLGNLVVGNKGGLFVGNDETGWQQVLSDGTLKGRSFVIRNTRQPVATINAPGKNPIAFSTHGLFRDANTVMLKDHAPLAAPSSRIASLALHGDSVRGSNTSNSNAAGNPSLLSLSVMGDPVIPINPAALSGSRVLTSVSLPLPKSIERDLIWDKIKDAYDSFRHRHRILLYVIIFLVVLVFAGVIARSIF